MELTIATVPRPAEYALRAHLAHQGHHELLADGQRASMNGAIAELALPSPDAPPTKPKTRRRRST